ncbi:MAG: cytochrome b/b6 domain-containing protein [Porticoccaceae bacterium]|nr:cytochrome b/b6 domain-containing protein [Porticoccaceae bacterium]
MSAVGKDNSARYSAVAITLHWLIAALVMSNIVLGIWMHDAIDVAASRGLAVGAYQLHKSLGLSILALSILRLVWRLGHRPPALPGGMKRLQRRLATAVHLSFYLLMIGVPLTGWLFVSTQWRGDVPLNVDTVWFDRITVPHLFNLHQQSADVRQQAAATFADIHAALALSMALLVVLHVGAALLHQLHARDQLLVRVLFNLSAMQPKRRRNAHWLGFLLTALVLVCSAYYGSSVFRSTTATPDLAAVQVTSEETGWQVNPSASSIRFAGEHAETRFSGRFLRWHIDAQLYPNNINASRLSVDIETGSARDGNPLHDRTLPEPEWFDTRRFPFAYYRTTSMVQTGNRQYTLMGTLDIKGNVIPIDGLTLLLGDNQALISGDLVIDRARVDMGMQSDPSGTWVSPKIRVSIAVQLQRPQD